MSDDHYKRNVPYDNLFIIIWRFFKERLQNYIDFLRRLLYNYIRKTNEQEKCLYTSYFLSTGHQSHFYNESTVIS